MSESVSNLKGLTFRVWHQGVGSAIFAAGRQRTQDNDVKIARKNCKSCTRVALVSCMLLNVILFLILRLRIRC